MADKKIEDVKDAKDNVLALVNQLHARYAGGMSYRDTPIILSSVMEMVERVGGMTGPEKKNMAIAAIRSFLDAQTALDPITKTLIMDLVPHTIDTLVYATTHLPSYASKDKGGWCCC